MELKVLPALAFIFHQELCVLVSHPSLMTCFSKESGCGFLNELQESRCIVDVQGSHGEGREWNFDGFAGFHRVFEVREFLFFQ